MLARSIVPSIALNRIAPRTSALRSSPVRTMASLSGDTFFLDGFAQRQWDDPNFAGTRFFSEKEEFVRRVHAFHAEGCTLLDGYAPFCKHIIVPNFVGAAVGALPITEANRHLVVSEYTKRRPEELAVLTRWFPADKVEAHEAKFLDVILYSRVQIMKEYVALPSSEKTAEIPDAPWGIISIKAQDEDFETPMQPITMLRNALGREEGGSGVPLDRQKYQQSVDYWQSHASIQ